MIRPFVLFITTLILVNSAHAGVNVDFVPANPGTCSDDFYMRSTSLELLKVKESEDAIQVRIRINYFDCHGSFAPQKISQTPEKIVTLLSNGFNWPWSTLPDARIQSRLSSSKTSAEVMLEFSKAEVLEGATYGSKSYRLVFAPELMSKGYVFEWRADLDVSLTNGSKLRLIQVQK